MKRKICVITGSRADYGILTPVLTAISRSRRLKLLLVATGMHLMREFGYTLREIEKDGFPIFQKVNISYREDTGEAMAFSVGRGVSAFSKSFQKLRPDIIVILGDRGEMMAAAIAANYMNIPVAHIHGGEVSGHVDGIVRHAITKLAHIHFAAIGEAAERIKKLGEEPFRIFVVGAPALDRIRCQKFTDEKTLRQRYHIDRQQPLVLIVQHPVNTQIRQAKEQMRATLEAVAALGLPAIVIYPNVDAGGRSMIRQFSQYRKHRFLKFFPSISQQDYLGLMRIAKVLIGNSSSGLIEAPSFKLPVVNIGSRQDGRQRGLNVMDVPNDRKAITRAIHRALFEQKFKERLRRCVNPYGDGRAAARIVKVLATIPLGERLLQKRITY